MSDHRRFRSARARTVAALAVAACLVALAACTTARRPVEGPPDAFAAAARLGRGINLGNALEAPREGEWGVTIRDEYFDVIAQAGFESVRIPARWSAHAEAAAPFAIDSGFMDRVAEVVGQALRRGLTVVLNIHHYEELNRDPGKERERFLALWEQIARRFRDQPDALFFEILNEPNDRLTAERWNGLLRDALAVIRRTNPRRAVVVGTAEWGGLRALERLELPEDDRNLIVTFHYYEPFAFTHQGAEWVAGSDAWLGAAWAGTPAEREAVAADLDRAARWAADRRRPLYMGEFGAYKKANEESRARWTAFVAREAEARRIPWAYWEFCSGFGAYDAREQVWRAPLLNALTPR